MLTIVVAGTAFTWAHRFTFYIISINYQSVTIKAHCYDALWNMKQGRKISLSVYWYYLLLFSNITVSTYGR